MTFTGEDFLFQFCFSERFLRKAGNYLPSRQDFIAFLVGIQEGMLCGSSSKGMSIKKLHSGKRVFEARLNRGDRVLFSPVGSFCHRDGRNAPVIVFWDVQSHDGVSRAVRGQPRIERWIHYNNLDLQVSSEDQFDDKPDAFVESILNEVTANKAEKDELLVGGRFFSFSNLDELKAWVEGQGDPFLKLTEEQWRLTDPAIDGPLFLYGGPGSGKTTVMLYRILRIAEPDETLFITWGERLLQTALSTLERIPVARAIAQKVTFSTFFQLKNLNRQYKHVFVDESQDLNTDEFRRVLDHCRDTRGLCFSADMRQNILSTSFSLKNIVAHLRRYHEPRFEEIGLNLRNTRNIYQFALKLFDRFPEALPDEYRKILSKPSETRGFPVGFWYTISSSEWEDLRAIVEEGHMEENSIAVIVPDASTASRICDPHPQVLTVEQAKGLEFDGVIAVNFLNQVSNRWRDKASVQAAYVGFTRARHSLLVLEANRHDTFAGAAQIEIPPLIWYHWYVNQRIGKNDSADLKKMYTEAVSAARKEEERSVWYKSRPESTAKCWIKAGEFNNAASLWESVERVELAGPLYEMGGDLYNAARMRSVLRDHDEARELFLEIGALDEAITERALAGDIDEALDECEVLEKWNLASDILTNPQISFHLRSVGFFEAAGRKREADLARAQIAINKGDLSEAARLYLKAKELRSAAEIYLKTGNWLEAGCLLEKLGDAKEAVAAFRKGCDLQKALSLCRGSHLIREEGEILFELGELSASESCFRKSGGLQSFAKLCELHGKSDKAIEIFVEIGDLENALELTIRMGNIKAAAKINESMNQWQFAADLHREVGDFDHAEKDYLRAGNLESAVKMHQQAGNQLRAGELCWKNGFHEQAMKIFSDIGEIEKVRELAKEMIHLTWKTGSARHAFRAAEWLMRAGDPEAAWDVFLRLKEFKRATECFRVANTERKDRLLKENASWFYLKNKRDKYRIKSLLQLQSFKLFPFIGSLFRALWLNRRVRIAQRRFHRDLYRSPFLKSLRGRPKGWR